MEFLITFVFADFFLNTISCQNVKKCYLGPKIIVVEGRDHFFWIPRVISDQKHSLSTEKNFFWIFSIKSNFSSIFPLQPYDKPYLNEKRYSKCNDNHYSCRVKVLDDIKVQKNPRTGILAWILGHNLTSSDLHPLLYKVLLNPPL